jgi:hypothetical protein
VTDHDDQGAAAAAAAAEHNREVDAAASAGVLVTLDEAKKALWDLGGAAAPAGGAAEILRRIILAGRDARVLLEPQLPPTRQYASLAELAAATDLSPRTTDAGKVHRVEIVLNRWRDVRQLADAGHYLCELYDGVAAAIADDPAPYQATDQRDLMVEVIRRAGDNGIMASAILDEMARAGRPWKRSDLNLALFWAVSDGLIVQPLEGGRYHPVPQPDGGQ